MMKIYQPPSNPDACPIDDEDPRVTKRRFAPAPEWMMEELRAEKINNSLRYIYRAVIYLVFAVLLATIGICAAIIRVAQQIMEVNPFG